MVMEGALSNGWQCEQTLELRMVRERFRSLASIGDEKQDEEGEDASG
jgi:hypothetical protein